MTIHESVIVAHRLLCLVVAVTLVAGCGSDGSDPTASSVTNSPSPPADALDTDVPTEQPDGPTESASEAGSGSGTLTGAVSGVQLTLTLPTGWEIAEGSPGTLNASPSGGDGFLLIDHPVFPPDSEFLTSRPAKPNDIDAVLEHLAGLQGLEATDPADLDLAGVPAKQIDITVGDVKNGVAADDLEARVIWHTYADDTYYYYLAEGEMARVILFKPDKELIAIVIGAGADTFDGVVEPMQAALGSLQIG